MSARRIANRYAKSLIDLAIERNSLDRINDDVLSFEEASKNRDFYLMLKSPIISGDKKKAIFSALFDGKYDKLTLAFLNILVDKGRESILPEVADEFRLLYKKYKRVSTVQITTAVKVGQDTLDAIKKKLVNSSSTEENLEIVTNVDPNIIGGFVAQFEDKIYDASIASKLDALRKRFKGNLYISQIIAN